MSHLIWIFAVCKSLLLLPVAVKELNVFSLYIEHFRTDESITVSKGFKKLAFELEKFDY